MLVKQVYTHTHTHEEVTQGHMSSKVTFTQLCQHTYGNNSGKVSVLMHIHTTDTLLVNFND